MIIYRIVKDYRNRYIVQYRFKLLGIFISNWRSDDWDGWSELSYAESKVPNIRNSKKEIIYTEE